MMNVIPTEAMEKTEAKFLLYDEKETIKLVRRFQKKQTALMVYLAAISEREELNDEEQDYLFTQALVIWEVMLQYFPKQKKVSVNRAEEMDSQMLKELEHFANQDDAAQWMAGEAFLQSHPQPDLLGYLAEHTMEADSQTGIREDMKGILFFALKNVLDLLIEVSS